MHKINPPPLTQLSLLLSHEGISTVEYDLFTVPGGDGQWVVKVAVYHAALCSAVSLR